jgi:hypothetical protein
MDTYGYIYADSFNPAFPTFGPVAEDDNTGGNGQFSILIVSQSFTEWILLVTTFRPNVTGAFTITATGPAVLEFTRMNAAGEKSSYSKSDLESNESLIDISTC